MNAKREARRKRDREDFLRATRAAVPAKLRAEAGQHAGPTYREHLENKLDAAVSAHKRATADGNKEKVTLYRGIIRGLAMALTLYEDSYNYDTKLLKIERQFMED